MSSSTHTTANPRRLSASRPQSPLVVPTKKRNKVPGAGITPTVAPAGYQTRQVFVPQGSRHRTVSAQGKVNGEVDTTTRNRSRTASGATGSMRRKSGRTKTTLVLPTKQKAPPLPSSTSQTITSTPTSQRVRPETPTSRVPITPYTAKLHRTIQNYNADKDPIKTFLRIRPLKPGTEPVDPFITVINDKEIKINTNDRRTRPYTTTSKYLFTRVFDSHLTQQAMFQSTTLPVIQELFDGYNTLIFAYGVTNSGKTYTIQGTRDQPGIIPRTMNIILHHIKDAQSQSRIRPIRATEAAHCIEDPLVWPQFRVSREQSYVKQTLNDLLAPDEHILNLDTCEFEYAVWVSYAEIYNEYIYDLLDLKTLITGTAVPNEVAPNGSRVDSPEPSAASKRATRRKHQGSGVGISNDNVGSQINVMDPVTMSPSKRTTLKIRTNPDDDYYLEGITEVRVHTLEDALAVLAHGQRHRTANSTLLNAESSRSHSIFTIKLLRIRRGLTVDASTQLGPQMVQVQKMSIVDLAGSERAAKTHNTGERLHEAGMINKSLMVLSNCLETLRFNQFKHDRIKAQIVPFRESQLTKLFQSSFMGGAKTVMLVNVNPFDDSFEETQRVLKFAAVAKDVTTVHKPVAATPLYRAVLHNKPPAFGLYEEPPEQDRPPKRKRGTPLAVPDPSEINSDIASPSLVPSSPFLTTHTRCSSPATTIVDLKLPVPGHFRGSPGESVDLVGAEDSTTPLELVSAIVPPVSNDPPDDKPDSPMVIEGESEPMHEPTGVAATTFSFNFPTDQTNGGAGEHPDSAQRVPRDSVCLTQDEWQEHESYTAQLRKTIDELKQQYAEAQYRCAQIECEVRQELSQDYNRKILEMEERYNQRLQDEVHLNEERCKTKLDILTRTHSATVQQEEPLTPAHTCDHQAQLDDFESTVNQLRSELNRCKIQEAQFTARVQQLTNDLDSKHASWQEEKTLRLLLKNQNTTLENELRRAKGIRTECDRRISSHGLTWQSQVKDLNRELEQLTKDHARDRMRWEREKFNLEASLADLRGQLQYEKEGRRSLATQNSINPEDWRQSRESYDYALLQQIQKLQKRLQEMEKEKRCMELSKAEHEAGLHDLQTKNEYLVQQIRILHMANANRSTTSTVTETPATSKVLRVFQHLTPEAKQVRSPSVPTSVLTSLANNNPPSVQTSRVASHGQPFLAGLPLAPAAPLSASIPGNGIVGGGVVGGGNPSKRLMKSNFIKKSLFGKKQLQYDEYAAEVVAVDQRQQLTGAVYRGPIIPTATGGINVVFSELAQETLSSKAPTSPTRQSQRSVDSSIDVTSITMDPFVSTSSPGQPEVGNHRPAAVSQGLAPTTPQKLRRQSSIDLGSLRTRRLPRGSEVASNSAVALVSPQGSAAKKGNAFNDNVPSSPSRRLFLSPWLEKAKATFRN
ncbi:hypothetical protein IWQ61_008791 [Dispira simplex]|nr:hypothetical protein IWQ61_008791 [Dispira simplex]